MAETTEKRTVTRDIPALSMRADVRPGSVDSAKRTVDVVWTTAGTRVARGFYDRYYEVLSLDPKHVRMARLQNKAPFLDCHNGWSTDAVLGVVESARLEPGQGVATIRFAKAEDDPEADVIFRKIQDGILTHISVGYRIYKMEPAGEAEDKTPIRLATDWEPLELSVVPIAADDGAGFRSTNERATNACVFEERAMPDQIPAPVAAAPVAPPAAAPAPAPSADDVRAAATRAERERSTAIRSLIGRQTLLPAEERTALADDLVGRGVSLEEARGILLEKLAERSGSTPTDTHVRIEAGETSGEKFVRGASAWLIHKAALLGTFRQAVEKGVEGLKDIALDPGEFRGLTLLELARESLERDGVKTRGLGKRELVARAFTHRSHGGNTSSDFPILLENVLHKTLLAAYATTPDTWTRFCAVRSASDFRVQNFYRNGAFGTLDKLSEAGEYKRKAIPDGEKHGFAIDTKGNIIAITRKAIINDDMGAFTDLGTRLGRASKLSIEVDAYDYLKANGGLGVTQADGKALFHADHANIGAGSEISVAGIDADRIVLASQKDPSGNEILDLRPAVLVVPIGIGGKARVINTAQYDVDPVDTKATNKFQVPNRVAGLFRDVVDTARLTGTRRYLFADPNEAPVLAVAFLDGEQNPYLETQLGWNVDGTEFKVRVDYGVGVIDTRGAVTNAGTP